MSYYLPYYFELDEAYEDGYDDLAFEWEEGWLDARFDYRMGT